MNFIFNFFKLFIYKQNPIKLGRWNIDYCSNKISNKVYLSNIDHCGTCNSFIKK